MFRQSLFSMVSPSSVSGGVNKLSAAEVSGARPVAPSAPRPAAPARALTPPVGESLTPFAARWLLCVPEAVRPVITAGRHPHIINKMALVWRDPRAVEEYFNSLLISSRPSRQGFSLDVLSEILELQQAVQEGRAG